MMMVCVLALCARDGQEFTLPVFLKVLYFVFSCHHLSVEVRGQLRISPLFPLRLLQLRLAALHGECLYPLSNLILAFETGSFMWLT